MKTAIVTGATSGIGSAITKVLAEHGYFVALVGRDKQKLEALLNKIDSQGKVFTCDLSKIDEVNKLIKDLTGLDNLSALINVAGIWHNKDTVFANTDFEDFEQQVVVDTLNVGLMAPTLLSHGLIPFMSKGSSIINISGTFENGAKGWIPYFISKKGIEDLTLGLSQELEDKDIRVNCISPSDTNTEAYVKFFPEYIEDAVEPVVIAKQILKVLQSDITGKFLVVKKGKEVYEGYHE